MEIDQLTDAQIASLTSEQVEELENNPASVSKFFPDETDDKSEDEPKQEEDPQETDEESAANGAGETDEEEEEKQPVILTKNGKGTIPYEKHKSLRVENATLRAQVESLQKAQAELETLKKQHTEAKTPGRRAEIQERLNSRITAMKEDFPDVGASLDDVKELITEVIKESEEEKARNKAKAEAEAAEKKRQEEEQQRVIDEQVQEAKDNNPDLSYWEKNDEDAWNEALMQDQILLRKPYWRSKSYEERFIEVAKRVRAVMPEASEPPTEAPSAKTKEKAKAAIEKATTRKPTTLSDIKGGANPTSEREQLENLSPQELVRKLTSMPAHQASAMRSELD